MKKWFFKRKEKNQSLHALKSPPQAISKAAIKQASIPSSIPYVPVYLSSSSFVYYTFVRKIVRKIMNFHFSFRASQCLVNPCLLHYCRVCNIQLNSCRQAKIHSEGKKHEKRLSYLKFCLESSKRPPFTHKKIHWGHAPSLDRTLQKSFLTSVLHYLLLLPPPPQWAKSEKIVQ